MNKPILEFDIQSFQIDLDNGLVIDVSKWPDQSGFVTVRRKDGVPIRGVGFNLKWGNKSLADMIYQLEEEFNEDMDRPALAFDVQSCQNA